MPSLGNIGLVVALIFIFIIGGYVISLAGYEYGTRPADTSANYKNVLIVNIVFAVLLTIIAASLTVKVFRS